MKKLVYIYFIFLAFSCSKDNALPTDTLLENSTNNEPIFTAGSFAIDEHTAPGTIIGNIVALDADDDELTFDIDVESGLEIDEITGQLTLGNTLILDFETATNLIFAVSVFDGKAIVEQDFELSINDIDEYELLSEYQKDVIGYFQYLTLWQSPTHTALERNSKWQAPMKLYLDGSYSNTYKTNVEEVIAEYNELFIDSDFSISLVETQAESNAHLFFGQTAELENLWADMFEIVDGKTYSGYAITSNTDSELGASRIWVSSELSILFKHELGHSLGFGHSDKCTTDNSFMCSNISPNHDFLEIEKEVISYAYATDMPVGITSEEIRSFLANKMVMEE